VPEAIEAAEQVEAGTRNRRRQPTIRRTEGDEMMVKRLSILAGLSMLVLASSLPASAGAVVAPKFSVTKVGIGITGSIKNVTTGPDGNVWFTSTKESGLITPTGAVKTFPGLTAGDITAGPDGNLWFTSYPSAIGRIKPTGTITTFPDGITGYPQYITTGPDGNLWFTEMPKLQAEPALVARITPQGVVTEFPLGASSETLFLAGGADGNVWFPDSGAIVRITPAGVMTRFEKGVGQALDITAGPDGNMWFTEQGAIGRITPKGVVTKFTRGITGKPTRITLGPDRNLWFTEFNRKFGERSPIGRITPKGVVTEIHEGVTGFSHFDLTAGSDGAIWFAGSHYLGRINVVPRNAVAICRDRFKHNPQKLAACIRKANNPGFRE
jgi:streptogramin lyase